MANRFLVAGGDGLWSSTNNWAATSGGASGASFPVAGDAVAFDSLSGNANMTVNVASACASLIMSGGYAGTLTFDSTLTLTSTCTFLSTCAIAGTAGTLIVGNTTLTSGGKTLTCAMTFSASATYTLADDWVVNGLVTAGVTTGSTTINGVGRTLTCAGGFRQAGTSAAVGGSAKLVITGGTWDSSSSGLMSMDVDLAGAVTVSGAILWGTTSKTLRRVSGTITTTGSTITFGSSAVTLDTAGVTWNNLTFASQTYTLSSALAWSGTLTLGSASTFAGAGAISGTGAVATTAGGTATFNNTGGLTTTGTMTLPNGAFTFAGSSGFSVGTMTTATLTASRTHTLTFGRTYTVTTALANVGTTAAILQSIVSSSPGNKVVFNLQAGATCDLIYCNPTDIDSSGGREIITTRGVITNSTNWATAPTSGGGTILIRRGPRR